MEMIATSERRLITEGESRHSLTKRLELSGRPVKIYVIDPKQFQAQMEKWERGKGGKNSSSKGTGGNGREHNNNNYQYHPYHHPQEKKDNNECQTTNQLLPPTPHSVIPIPIAPKEPVVSMGVGVGTQTTNNHNHHHHGIPVPGGTATAAILLPQATLLPLPMIPVSLSLPIVSMGGVVGATMVGTANNGHPHNQHARIIPHPSSSSVQINNVNMGNRNGPEVKKKVVKKKKRKLTFDKNRVNEMKDPEELQFLRKESTSRTGRICKSVVAASEASSVQATPKPPPPQKPKKREPPEKFKCLTCQKFYLGNSKFYEHFETYPDHVKPDPNAKKATSAKKPKITVELVHDDDVVEVPPPQQPQHESPKRIEEVQVDEDSLGISGFSPSPVTQERERPSCSTISVVNPDTLSDNCRTSPKLSVFSQLENHNGNGQGGNPSSISVSSPSRDHREYFMELSELIGVGNCSQQSFNSLDNLLGAATAENNSNNHERNSVASNQPMTSSRPSPASVPNGGTTTSGPTFFSVAANSGSGTSPTSSYYSANPVSISAPTTSTSSSSRIPVVTIDDENESKDTCISNSSGSGSDEGGIRTNINEQRSVAEMGNHPQPQNHGEIGHSSGGVNGNGSVPKRRSIWEFVKEQIRLCGINHTCGEISEMAEKLSKIARDKFYPIQEDEVERKGTSSPIIHVDTPFISHLLDLPYGTYVFKEDGGMRKVIPPPTPVSTELSLTNGVEVDVDKFLSPDMDLVSLPHLTNLDFNSICN